MTYLFDAFRLRPLRCLRPHHKSVMGRPSAGTTNDVPRLRRSHTARSRVDQATRREGFVYLDESGEAGFLRTTFKAICSSQVCHTRGHWEPPSAFGASGGRPAVRPARGLYRAVLPATSLAADRAAR